MLIIKQPYIKENRLYFVIFENNIEKLVWFEVEEKYVKYLCHERCDAILIGLLNYAMRNNHDIIVEGLLTETLIYNINNFLIPALCKGDRLLNNIKIIETLKSTPPIESVSNAVGTGLSCGVDSFHSILTNLYNAYETHKITHLCINNVGAFNECYEQVGIDCVREKRYEKAKIVAKKLNLPIIMSNSNFAEMFPQNHLLTHTYSSVFAVYCLQKLWSIYYYGSSGYDLSVFNLKNNSTKSSDLYELLSLNCFSLPNLKIYSDGAVKNRLEKTEAIVDYDVVQNYLHVCTRDYENCGVCDKCMRTLLTLDSLNKLDDFKSVFNIEYYKKHKNKYYEYLLFEHIKNNKMLEPIYHKMKDKFSFSLKFKGYLKYYLKIRKEKTKTHRVFIMGNLSFKIPFFCLR